MGLIRIVKPWRFMEAKRENLHKTIRSTLALDGQGGQEEGEKNMDNSRDTQFAGFASLLLGEMLQASKTYSGLIDSEDGAWRQSMEGIIARCAYDLVNHAMHKLIPYDYETNRTEDLVSFIPDLTELPGQNQPE